MLPPLGAVLHVRPAEHGRLPSWLGPPGVLSTVLCQAMMDVLLYERREADWLAGILRLDLRQDTCDIGRAHNTLPKKVGKIAFLGLLVESEVQMLWIHLAAVEIGNIPHGADGKREIEFHCIRFLWLACHRLEFCQAVAPKEALIVLR